MNNSIYIVLAAILGFGITAVLGIFMIPFLHKLKFGQTIREVGPSWHQKKQGTPTMGGLMFIIGIVVAVMICVPLHLSVSGGETFLSVTRIFSGLLMAVAFGVIGFFDDFISIVKKRNLGLTEKQKLLLQFLIAGGYLASEAIAGAGTDTYIPFVGLIDLGYVYYVLSALLIVGIVNAVNFTDGVDGLNSSVTCFVCVALMICSFMLYYQGIAVFAAASAGACIGFMLWNFNPAKIFMGDTGSLFLGGLVCALSFGIERPILLLPLGIIYILEIVSVVLQVVYFKLTKGKRLFKMAPIHHHFEMSGWSEVKICVVFSIITILGAAVAILSTIYG